MKKKTEEILKKIQNGNYNVKIELAVSEGLGRKTELLYKGAAEDIPQNLIQNANQYIVNTVSLENYDDMGLQDEILVLLRKKLTAHNSNPLAKSLK